MYLSLAFVLLMLFIGCASTQPSLTPQSLALIQPPSVVQQSTSSQPSTTSHISIAPQSLPLDPPIATQNSIPARSIPSKPAITEQQAAENRVRPYLEGLEALKKYKGSSVCDNEFRTAIMEDLSVLKEHVSILNGLSFSSAMRQYGENARDWHVSLSFEFADTALKKGCLDTADQVYRDLIYFYVGAAYTGIRDRAHLGVEDVRDARNK